ncbi:MAG: hypothetical protein IAF58_02800 [Leptolyngbya sp.]|nr:hypothetical protein [Candidatus Melainabacteria bacterium]
MGNELITTPETEKPSFGEVFLQSARHSAWDSPMESLGQIKDKITGATPEASGNRSAPITPEQRQRAEALAPAEFNTSKWYAQQLGSAVGIVPWVIGLHFGARGATRFLVRPGAIGLTDDAARLVYGAHRIETATPLALNRFTFGKNALGVAESTAAGLTYGGVFQPVHGDDSNFWSSRAKNAFVSGVTFATMTKGSQLAKDFGLFGRNLPESAVNSQLTNTVTERFRTAAIDRLRGAGQTAVGGMAAGPVDAFTRAAITEGKLPTLKQVGESTFAFTMVGGMFGLAAPTGRGRFSEKPEQKVEQKPVEPPVENKPTEIPKAKVETPPEVKLETKPTVETLEANALTKAGEKNYKEAAELFAEAAKIREGEKVTVGDPAYVKALTNNLNAGRCLWRAGEFKDAEPYITKAKEALEVWRCHSSLADVYTTLGDIHKNLGNLHEGEVFSGRGQGLKAPLPEAKESTPSGVKDTELKPSEEAKAQREFLKEEGYLTEPLADGTIYNPNMTIGNDAARIIVSPKSDPVLKAAIDQAEANFGSLKDKPHEALAALGQFAERLLTSKDGSDVSRWSKEFDAAYPKDKVAYLGEYIAEGKGVCNQRALLLKAFADRLGIPLTVRYGFVEINGRNEPHMFGTYSEKGTTYVYDPGLGVYGEKLSNRPEYQAPFMGNWMDNPQ